MKLPKVVMKLCLPAKIYLALAVISTLYYVAMMIDADGKKHPDSKVQVHTYTMVGLLFKGFFAVFWVVFLNYLCSTGHRRMAWLFLFLPLILMAIIMVLMTFTLAYISSAMDSQHHKMDRLTSDHKAGLSSQNDYWTDQMNQMKQFKHQEGSEPKVEGFNL